MPGHHTRLDPPQVLALILVLMIVAALFIGLLVSSVASAVWPLIIVQSVIAIVGGWVLHQNVRHAQQLSRQEAQQSQSLLERLSIATQAAGIYCWELDWNTYAITWDESRLPAAEAAAASRRHFGVELGSDLFKYVHPDDQHAGGKAMAESLARGEDHVSFRYRLVLPDGSIRHVQAFARTYTNAAGKPQRSLGVSWDVTEEVHAAESMARREAELEALSIRFGIATRAAQAGVWEWQEQNDALWWNEMMYAIYGCPPETYQPNIASVIGMIHPDDLALAQAAWENAMLNTGQLHVQFRILRPDGTVAHVDQLAAMVRDSQTSHRRLVGITLDVGQRVAAEQRERILQKKLREASHQSGMAEVATGVLHNVGNVLNSLGVASSTAQSRLKASQFERVQRVAALFDEHRDRLGEFLTSDPRGKRMPEYLHALGAQLEKDAADVNQEIEALNGHIQYLREIVHAQQSFARVGDAEEVVDVRELVDTALALQSRDLKDLEIRREIAQIPEVLTDRYKLLQIIVNFIGNAHDAVRASDAATRRITVRAAVVSDQLEIAVEDSGVGIPTQLLPRVWEFGFTTKAHGHGFGLHSAAVAAQALGGSVDAYSAGSGLGARFSVKIPFKTVAARDAADTSRTA